MLTLVLILTTENLEFVSERSSQTKKFSRTLGTYLELATSNFRFKTNYTKPTASQWHCNHGKSGKVA